MSRLGGATVEQDRLLRYVVGEELRVEDEFLDGAFGYIVCDQKAYPGYTGSLLLEAPAEWAVKTVSSLASPP